MLVVVAGATGRLGGVVDVLLERGHAVRALTRDPPSAAAALLREAGAEVMRGDFEDVGGMARAAADADAFFAAGTAHQAGPDGELRHGRNVAEAAALAGVEQLVYVSGEGTAADSPLPLFRAKAGVEEAIAGARVPATILAPVYFAENVVNPWNRPALHEGIYPSPIPVDVPLQQVAIADVARFAVLALERRLLGRFVLASDELTGNEAAAALGDAIGRELRAEHVVPPPVQPLFAWLERHPGGADVAALRRDHPEVGWHRYGEWARAQLGRFREPCPEPDAVPA